MEGIRPPGLPSGEFGVENQKLPPAGEPSPGRVEPAPSNAVEGELPPKPRPLPEAPAKTKDQPNLDVPLSNAEPVISAADIRDQTNDLLDLQGKIEQVTENNK